MTIYKCYNPTEFYSLALALLNVDREVPWKLVLIGTNPANEFKETVILSVGAEEGPYGNLSIFSVSHDSYTLPSNMLKFISDMNKAHNWLPWVNQNKVTHGAILELHNCKLVQNKAHPDRFLSLVPVIPSVYFKTSLKPTVSKLLEAKGDLPELLKYYKLKGWFSDRSHESDAQTTLANMFFDDWTDPSTMEKVSLLMGDTVTIRRLKSTPNLSVHTKKRCGHEINLLRSHFARSKTKICVIGKIQRPRKNHLLADYKELLPHSLMIALSNASTKKLNIELGVNLEENIARYVYDDILKELQDLKRGVIRTKIGDFYVIKGSVVKHNVDGIRKLVFDKLHVKK